MPTPPDNLHATSSDSPSAGPPSHLPGRDDERRRLRAVHQRAHEGYPQYAAIEGPPGIGKTTLVDAFLAEVGGPNEEDCTVVELYPSDLNSPGALLRRIVTGLTERRTEPWPSTVEDSVQMVLDIVEHPADAPRFERPRILVIEDLQWIDRFSAEVLWRCSQELLEGQSMTVMTYRPHRTELSEEIDRFLASGRHGAHLQLEPLTVPQCREVLRDRLGIPVSEGIARQVHRGTDGVPLLVDTLARWLQNAPADQRRLQDALAALNSGHTGPTGGDSAQRLFGKALRSTLDAMSPQMRDAVSLLAIAGESLHLLQLEQALIALGHPGLPHEDLRSSSDVRINTTTAQIVMTHPHLATLMAEQVPAERRATLHRTLATVMNDLSALDHRVRAQTLVSHPEETPELVRGLMEQGQGALERRDGTAAFGYFRHALRLTGDPAVLALTLRATVVARSPELVLELRDLLGRLPESRPKSAALAWTLLASEDVDRAVEQIRRGLLLPEEDPTQAGLILLGHALAAAGRVSWAGGNFEATAATIDELAAQLIPVRQRFEEMARQEPRAYALVSEARSVEAMLTLWAGLRHGDRRRIAEFTATMTSLLAQLESVPGTEPVRNLIAGVVGSRLRAQGHIAEAQRLLRSADVGGVSPLEQRVHVESNLTQLAFHAGDWDRAQDHATRVVENCLMLPVDAGVRMGLAIAALVPLSRGARAEGAALMKRAKESGGASGDVVRCSVAQSYAMAAVFSDDPAEADRQFRFIESTLVGWATVGFTTVLLYARTLASRGLTEDLIALAHRGTAGMDSAPEGVLRAVASGVRGFLRRAQAEPKQAYAHLKECVEALDAEPAPEILGRGPDAPPGGGHALVRALMALELARVVHDHPQCVGTDDAASRWAQQSADFFLRCGAMVLHRQAEDLAMRLQDGEPAREPAVQSVTSASNGADMGSEEGGGEDGDESFRLMAGLSPRERQIALAVAAGKNERQIATELFISLRTVEYHLDSCLAKLNVATRTGLLRALQPVVQRAVDPAVQIEE
ncbi:AAA family ATPase [Citricoccus sp. GCM10030269]|uniref:helix-turn-helix transcriptional regulator n=1 Tax=Citricoccus sp. GCM10030269 TaxID=3273388 RepID=UPI003611E843